MTSLSEVCSRPFGEIRFEEYERLISHIATNGPGLAAANNAAQGAVVQYWDQSPDRQVRKLLEATQAQCGKSGFDWEFFDDRRARAFLGDQMGHAYLAAYQQCIHPAQRSDFFRYCYLSRHGGMWLDADLVLIDSPAPVLRHSLPVFLQRPTHGGITNWFLATPPQHPLFAALVETCLRNLGDNAFRNQCADRRDILTSTGVVAINRVVARYAHRRLCAADGPEFPFVVINDAQHNRFIQSGGRWLGETLGYKRDARAWQTWCAEVPGNPLEPETLKQLYNSTDPDG